MLDALQGVLQLGLNQVPELAPLAKRVSRKDLKDGQVLSISLSTGLIPREKMEPEVLETLESMLDSLEARKLVLSIGLRGDVLLMSISEDVSPILDVWRR